MTTRVLSFRYQATAEQRLDRFLADSAPEYSRARLQALIKKQLVLVDGSPARKSGQMIGPGTVVELCVPANLPSGLEPEAIPLDIIFENQDVLVVNKPAGMVVHPAAGHATGTLVNAAIGHDPAMQGIGGEDRPGVVHRLDKDTSGLILLAKNDRSMRWLQEQFGKRLVSKSYIALVDGHPPSPAGRVETAIGRDPVKRKQMAVVPEGKGRMAVSEYRTLESFARHTLLEVHPLTGRTHQIRVQCAFLGCPIVGDTVYGLRRPSIAITRHFLHAASIKISLPGDGRPREFAAPMPAELSEVLEGLRREARTPSNSRQESERKWNS